MSREISWLSMVQRADPDFSRKSRYVIEYEMTAYGMGADERTHENGMRVFRGNYDVRGPYAAQDVPDSGLVWNGQPIIWSSSDLVWDED